jgi:hypothetical protein
MLEERLRSPKEIFINFSLSLSLSLSLSHFLHAFLLKTFLHIQAKEAI